MRVADASALEVCRSIRETVVELRVIALSLSNNSASISPPPKWLSTVSSDEKGIWEYDFPLVGPGPPKPDVDLIKPDVDLIKALLSIEKTRRRRKKL